MAKIPDSFFSLSDKNPPTPVDEVTFVNRIASALERVMDDRIKRDIKENYVLVISKQELKEHIQSVRLTDAMVTTVATLFTGVGFSVEIKPEGLVITAENLFYKKGPHTVKELFRLVGCITQLTGE